jgi:hypothetical protein
LTIAFALGCEPSDQAGAARPTAKARGREPQFTVPADKAVYARGRAGMAAIDALRGSVMTESLATDLGYKCADLRSVRQALAAERDPIVWQLRSAIDKTCGLDVPLASALFEIDRIEKKRAAGGEPSIKGECMGLRLAIGDVGQAYLDNPAVLDAGGKMAVYCPDGGDTVRRVPVP